MTVATMAKAGAVARAEAISTSVGALLEIVALPGDLTEKDREDLYLGLHAVAEGADRLTEQLHRVVALLSK
jgi:hypothetical protein